MQSIDQEAREFILKNNIFLYTGDDFSKYIKPGIKGINTWGIPNTEANIEKTKGSNSLTYPDKLVYKAKYTFDGYGRRNTVPTSTDATKKAIFFGDAMTFGEGLNDDETLPYYFEKYNKDYRSYNYGFLGHGPSHMLLHLKSQEFKQQFTGKKGRVFYVYRDDAIKVAVGQAPWNENYPRFVLNKDTLIYEGDYSGKNFNPKDMYLPSEYTVEDYELTLGILKECKEQLYDISKELSFHVVTLPITFTSDRIENLLIKVGIDVINLSLTDVEHYTNTQARFLDGVHTANANRVLAKKTTHFLSKPQNPVRLPDNIYTDINTGIQRIKERCFLMPSMVDFPFDDAGVIISLILQSYRGSEYNDIDFFNIAKLSFNSKLKILNKLNKDTTKEELLNLVGEVSQSSYFIDIVTEEYINTRLILQNN